MIKPSSPQEFREQGGYGQFEIAVQHSNFERTQVNRLYGRPDTCSPSFWITGKFRIESNRAYFVKGESYGYLKRDANQITRDDVKHFVQELQLIGGTSEEKEVLSSLYENLPCSVRDFRERAPYDWDSCCDYFRLDFEIPLRLALEKQKTIRTLKGEELRFFYEMLQKTPWKLWFSKFCGPLKEMTYKGWNTYAHRFKRALPPMFSTALRLYTYLKERREEGNDLFAVEGLFERYLCDFRWKAVAYEYNDERYVKAAFDFLMFHALESPLEGYVSLPKDIIYNRIIIEGLRFIKTNGNPQRRENNLVPCIPSATLSETQLAVIKHVHENPLTLLQGGPGTGKTEVLVALMASFAKPLVVTYVGMMVDALQRRFGKRTETAHTIHYICCLKELTEWGSRALKQFDMLIIDEGSNIDTHLFSRLMSVMSGHSTRLVIVGDLGQIFPISPGCPFADLVARYSSFHLLENKRVDPDARELAEASQDISAGRDVKFTENGALRIFPLPHEEEAEQKALLGQILQSYVQTLQDTMDMQIVVLRNVDRKLLNTWTEEILLERKILRPKQEVNVGGTLYYTGKKVIFTKNTKPILEKNLKEESISYDGVRNGELGQIQRIRSVPKSENVIVELVGGKRILISSLNRNAVDPYNIQPGYATTANKSQGSEWKNILFWIYPRPIPFSREYAYVAISRAIKRCTVVGSLEDFRYLCSWKAKPRSTLLSQFLLTLDFPHYEKEHIGLPPIENLKLLPPDVPAVPRIEPPHPPSSHTTKRGKGNSAKPSHTKGKP